MEKLCKLCGNVKVLVDSHIIPEAFFRIMGEDLSKVKIYSSDKEVFPKKARKGAYDQIVCVDCENIFGPWDQYAAEFLLDKNNFSDPIVDENGDIQGFEIPSVDYKRLKLFSLSLLWRASVSDHILFDSVDIGPANEAILADMILESNPGGPGDYPVVICKYDDRPASTVIGSARRLRTQEGINFYKIYFGGFEFSIKVDRQEDEAFSKLRLEVGKTFPVLYEKIGDTAEFKSMRNVAKLWTADMGLIKRKPQDTI